MHRILSLRNHATQSNHSSNAGDVGGGHTGPRAGALHGDAAYGHVQRAARGGRSAAECGPRLAPLWRTASATSISKDCSKQIDYTWLRTEVRSFWTDKHLYLLFTCPYRELNLFLPAMGGGPRNKLWDRDVVEMFLGDDWKNIRHYREFEIAPTGDWIDLAIDLDHESDDHNWRSGWTTAARIDEEQHVWYAAARIPLGAISTAPVKPGTKWRANLYRIEGLGADPQRRFLCWQPTCVVNRDPNHVPENFGTLVFTGDPDTLAQGRRRFETRCGGCHGADGMGGERAPAIGSGEHERVDSEDSVRALIHSGIPDAGMPPFNIPEPELSQLVAFVRSRVTPARESLPPGDAAKGEAFFFGGGHCAQCHSINGRGGDTGPDLSNAGEELTLAEIEQSLRNPASRRKPGYAVVTVRLRSGTPLHGLLRNESLYDLQLQDFDGHLHLLRRDEVAGIDRDRAPYMPALHSNETELQDLIAYLVNPSASEPSIPERTRPGAIAWDRIAHPRPGDWPTYHGQLSGNRYSTLRPDHSAQRRRLAPRWIFPIRRRAPSGSDAGGGGRRHVRHQRECRLGARRRHRPRDLALRAPPQQRPCPAMRRAASTAAWRCSATASSWSPTTPTCWRSTASPERSCGTPKWPIQARTTAPPPRRWWSTTW